MKKTSDALIDTNNKVRLSKIFAAWILRTPLKGTLPCQHTSVIIRVTATATVTVLQACVTTNTNLCAFDPLTLMLIFLNPYQGTGHLAHSQRLACALFQSHCGGVS